jgi:hypothetical protein
MNERDGLRGMNEMARIMGLPPLLTEPTELGNMIYVDMMRLRGEPAAAMREFCWNAHSILDAMEKFVGDPANKITQINWDTFRVVTQPSHEHHAYKIAMSMRAFREIQ